MAVESSVFNSMAEMDYEGAREFLERKDEHEKLYNSIIKKKDKETSKEKIENNFDSLEKWKEDMNRNLQQMEARLKIKRELEEERDGKYSINNNDKIENDFDLLEKKQENEFDSLGKIVEDMNRALQQRIASEKIEREFKEKIERKEREEREIKKNILKNFRELLKNSNDNNYSSDRVGRIK